MPDALLQYDKGWNGWSGTIPTNRKDMWSVFYNYYLNTIRDEDHALQEIVDVLDEMELWRVTVVVFTADHGEMGGAHGGLKGKGPFAYEANAHVPLVIAHPAGKAGATTTALTSHIDLVPTFVGLTGLPEAKRPKAVKALPGRDFSRLLVDPERAGVDTVRPGVLFNYVGVSTVDGDYPLLAQSGHDSYDQRCPLLGVKRTLRPSLHTKGEARHIAANKKCRSYKPYLFLYSTGPMLLRRKSSTCCKSSCVMHRGPRPRAQVLSIKDGVPH